MTKAPKCVMSAKDDSMVTMLARAGEQCAVSDERVWDSDDRVPRVEGGEKYLRFVGRGHGDWCVFEDEAGNRHGVPDSVIASLGYLIQTGADEITEKLIRRTHLPLPGYYIAGVRRTNRKGSER